MADYFNDVYMRRLNRYGLDYKSRVQNQRMKEFDDLLNKSAHRLDFEYGGDLIPGILNARKQDETQTLQNLLVRNSVELPSGTILELNKQIWMVYWLDNAPDSGYNKYIVLKMTHYLTWMARDKQYYSTWAYMYGQEDNMLKDELKSRSRNRAIYNENLKSSFFICPVNEKLRKDDYLEVGEGALKESYVITGYDIQSTPGVEFITIDPVYTRDNGPIPMPQEGDNADDFFWLQGE